MNNGYDGKQNEFVQYQQIILLGSKVLWKPIPHFVHEIGRSNGCNEKYSDENKKLDDHGAGCVCVSGWFQLWRMHASRDIPVLKFPTR